MSDAGPVIACIDGSAYSPSVTDHAAWLSSAMGQPIELLHLVELPPPAERPASTHGGGQTALPTPILEAAARLIDSGAEPPRTFVGHGSLNSLIAQLSGGATFVVLGRRGRSSAPKAPRLGDHIRSLVTCCRSAICLAPKIFLPPSRALVLQSGEEPDVTLSEFLVRTPALDGVDLDFVRYDLAQTPLAGAQADEDPPAARTQVGPDVVLDAYFDHHHCDLLLLPRSSLTQHPARGNLEAMLSRLRLPVLFPPAPAPV